MKLIFLEKDDKNEFNYVGKYNEKLFRKNFG